MKIKNILAVTFFGVITAALFRYLAQEADPPAVINVGDRMVTIYDSRTCQLKAVISGDTITCQDGTKAKLCGIAAPVNSSPAIAKLKELLLGKEIILSPMAKNSDRIVAEAFARISQDEEIFVNAEMVRSGVANIDPVEIATCLGKPQILDAGMK